MGITCPTMALSAELADLTWLVDHRFTHPCFEKMQSQGQPMEHRLKVHPCPPLRRDSLVYKSHGPIYGGGPALRHPRYQWQKRTKFSDVGWKPQWVSASFTHYLSEVVFPNLQVWSCAIRRTVLRRTKAISHATDWAQPCQLRWTQLGKPDFFCYLKR